MSRVIHTHTWAGVTITVEILDILYKRLLMTIDADPMATLKPMRSFVARQARTLFNERARTKSERNRLTNIAPDWDKDADVVMPNQPVSEDDHIGEESPANKQDGACVARMEMGRGGDGKKDEGDHHGYLMPWRPEVGHVEDGGRRRVKEEDEGGGLRGRRVSGVVERARGGQASGFAARFSAT